VAAIAAALLALPVVLALAPGERDLALQGYALFLGAMLVLWLLGLTRSAHPTRVSPFDEARRRREPRVERVPELAKVEREVTLGLGSAFDLHHRLRARIRDVAETRLAARHGIDLERHPDAACAVLDPALWELVRPDREVPRDRHGPGLSMAELRAVMDALDRI
jgi:hypothetical protein